MVFTKNRRGQVQEKLFYSLSNSGDVDYQRGRIDFGVEEESEEESVEVKMDPLHLNEIADVLGKLKI
jgi:hypothetical protein